MKRIASLLPSPKSFPYFGFKSFAQPSLRKKIRREIWEKEINLFLCSLLCFYSFARGPRQGFFFLFTKGFFCIFKKENKEAFVIFFGNRKKQRVIKRSADSVKERRKILFIPKKTLFSCSIAQSVLCVFAIFCFPSRKNENQEKKLFPVNFVRRELLLFHTLILRGILFSCFFLRQRLLCLLGDLWFFQVFIFYNLECVFMLTRCEHPLSLKKLAAPFSLCVLSEEARNHPEYVFVFQQHIYSRTV